MSARILPVNSTDAKSADPRLDDLVKFVGYRPNALLTMAKQPGLLSAILQLVGVTIRGDGMLPIGLRFMIASETSRGAGCYYSAVHAVHGAFHAGVDWKQLAALNEYETSSYFTPREQAALSIASAGATLPTGPTDQPFQRASQFYSEAEIVEIISIIALFGWFNRWNSLMNSELEEVPSEALKHVQWLSAMNHRRS